MHHNFMVDSRITQTANFLTKKEPRSGTCKLISQKRAAIVGTSNVSSAFITAATVWRRKETEEKQKEGIYRLRINTTTLFDPTMKQTVGSTQTLLSLETAAAGFVT